MTFEVQHRTIGDIWVNTWTVHHQDGTSEPETFPTRAAAQAALDEFFADIADEIAAGQREPDEGYTDDEFRIVPSNP